MKTTRRNFLATLGVIAGTPIVCPSIALTQAADRTARYWSFCDSFTFEKGILPIGETVLLQSVRVPEGMQFVVKEFEIFCEPGACTDVANKVMAEFRISKKWLMSAGPIGMMQNYFGYIGAQFKLGPGDVLEVDLCNYSRLTLARDTKVTATVQGMLYEGGL